MNPVAAVLFDRDGTLVEDVPYNADPDRVRLLPGAAAAVELARSHGLATGVVSNQSGIGRGLLTTEDVRRVNERADALLGGLDTWEFCPHSPDAGCVCRKPLPGLILAAAAHLGVPPAQCLVIGDIAADVLAAHAAGAPGLLVPNAATAPAEAARFAAQSAPDVLTALRTALATPGPRSSSGGAVGPDGPLSSSPEVPGAAGAWPSRQAAPTCDGARWSSGGAAGPDGPWSSSPEAPGAVGAWPSRQAAPTCDGARWSSGDVAGPDGMWSPWRETAAEAGAGPSRQAAPTCDGARWSSGGAAAAVPGRGWPSGAGAAAPVRGWSR